MFFTANLTRPPWDSVHVFLVRNRCRILGKNYVRSGVTWPNWRNVVLLREYLWTRVSGVFQNNSDASGTVRVFRLPPRCDWHLRSFAILRVVDGWILTDVSGQHIGTIFKDPWRCGFRNIFKNVTQCTASKITAILIPVEFLRFLQFYIFVFERPHIKLPFIFRLFWF